MYRQNNKLYHSYNFIEFIKQINRLEIQKALIDYGHEKFIEDNEPGLELTKSVKAPSGKEVYVNISFGAEFFRPFF
mgnify:CR=1 FL=1